MSVLFLLGADSRPPGQHEVCKRIMPAYERNLQNRRKSPRRPQAVPENAAARNRGAG